MFLKDIVLPKHIDDFVINRAVSNKIKKLFSQEFLSNLYIYGPSGCGKYSLFIKNLELIVNKQITIFPKTINLNSQWSSIKETTILSSEYHFEINLSKYVNNKNNLFSIIDAITESGEINSKLPLKLILIRNIQNASVDLVKFIKQKSEQLSDYVRFIVIGKTSSKNVAVLNGSFFCLRMALPTMDEIETVILPIIKKKIKKPQLVQVIQESEYNLSKIFTKLDMLILSNFYKTRLELTSLKISKLLLEKKFSSLYEIREAIYDYQTSNEDITELLKKVLDYIVKHGNLNIDKIIKLSNIICNIDISRQLSYKEIIHVEYGLFKTFKLIHS
jgi:hypothetical protein